MPLIKTYLKHFLILLVVTLTLSLLNSCAKDVDLFDLVSEDQVEEVSDAQDEGGNPEDEEATDETSEDETSEGEDSDTTDEDATDEDSDNQNDDNGDNDEDSDAQNDDDGDNGEDSDSTMGGTNQQFNIIFDSDTNNELDDQHALAYLLSNGDVFNLEAVTVNATQLGGDVDGHFQEAVRILKLYNLDNRIDVFRGANGTFDNIVQNFNPNNFDGIDAADIMIEKTLEQETFIVAVGKLTNVALALRKDPSLANRSRVIWLGSNYPNGGEYNEINDLSSVNYVIESGIPLEIVTVRLGGNGTGSAEVFVNVDEINSRMPGLGPNAAASVPGRDGGQFRNFGDYSVDLFRNIGKDTRSLFDLVALSILKNPNWGSQQSIPAPILVNGNWEARPQNSRRITIWERFDRNSIIEDFFESIENYTLVD